MVRNPRGERYITQSQIKVDGKIHNEKLQIKDIKATLPKSSFAETKKIVFFNTYEEPLPIDTQKINQSLKSIFREFSKFGYLDVKGSYTIEKAGFSKYRKKVVYHIHQGPLYLLSSVGGFFGHGDQDSIFLQVVKESEFLKPNGIFGYDEINNMLTEIQKKMNENGYPRFNKDFLNVIIDTTVSYLPIKKTKFRNMNVKSFQLYFSLSEDATPENWLKYKVKNVYVRLLKDIKDSAFLPIDKGLYYQDRNQKKPTFNDNFIRRQMPFPSMVGNYYSSKDIAFISNNFFNARSFSLVTQFSDYQEDSTMNVYYELSTRKKMFAGTHTDVSYNDGASTLGGLVQSQLVDVSISGEFGVTNLFKQSVQYNIFAKGGVQLSPNQTTLFSSQSISVSNIFRIPGFWLGGFYLPNNRRRVYGKSTNFSVEGLYFNRTEQFSLVNIRLYNSFNWGFKGYNFTFYPLNIEFYSFNKEPSFNLELSNTFTEIQNAYTDGNIISAIFSVSKSWFATPSFTINLAVSLEETGLYGSLYNKISNSSSIPLFLRNEVTFSIAKKINSKSSLAYRLYYGNNIYYTKDQHTPYFRKFFAGGPYSMRGWQNRTLGFGSISKDNASQFSDDKLGDLKLETNLEYRFNILKLSSFVFEGAVFTDIGNIWYKDAQLAALDERGVFSPARLLDDLAMDAGLGLRVKIGFFIIRLDYAYQLKNPQGSNVVSFDNNPFRDSNIQIGVGYPF